MRRRRYLALLGAGLAGCANRDGDAAPAATDATAAPTATPPGTRTAAESRTLENNEPYRTPDGWRLRVNTLRVRRGVIVHGDPHDEAVVPPDRQFLQVLVSTDGTGAPAPGDACLTATVDGERRFGDCTSRLEAVPPRRLGELHAVPVPLPTAAERAAVVWTGGSRRVRWRVPASTVAALGRPPAFVVESFAVPGRVPAGEPFEASLTVRNEGDRADWFVAELGLASAADGTNLEVAYDAGERRTVTRELTARFGGDDALTVRLDRGRDATERTVRRA
ncbi:MAG: hypothetical protein ABEJ61_08865 [Haloferacaceae archaeon]